MRSLLCILIVALLCAPSLLAQGDESRKGDAISYTNKELGLVFGGVYGWDKMIAEGSGAWTELARYKDDAYKGEVVLLVRDNPYATTADLKKVLAGEYAEGGELSESTPVYKEIQLRDVEMAKGLKLPGIELGGAETRIVDGKKREFRLLQRTYFGRNRLFRVHCSVSRARAKRVRDLFARVVTTLIVKAEDEKVMRGLPFNSQRGLWTCLVPEGYGCLLPRKGQNADMRFTDSRAGIAISVYAYPYDGILVDHVEEMQDYYRSDIEIESEETSVLGGKGFKATVTKGDQITLVVGTVRNKRVYRIHTACEMKALEAGKAAHDAFQQAFRIGR